MINKVKSKLQEKTTVAGAGIAVSALSSDMTGVAFWGQVLAAAALILFNELHKE